MMTQEQIVELIAQVHSACLSIELNGSSLKFGPGRANVSGALRNTTPEGMAARREKFEEWLARPAHTVQEESEERA